MASIGDVFLRLLLDDADFQKTVVARAQKAGDQAGVSMGSSLAAGLSKGATKIGTTLASIGSGLTKTGTALTTNLTLPLLAAGGAAAHFALDFDTSLRRTVALSDVTQEEIAGIREEILKLAPVVGKSPQELADSFYFLASAGFKSAEAIDVLTVAAKASGAGMGTTQDIAKVLGSTINAYGHENLTAAHAADILTAAVSDGAAEASDFAGALGRVVPVAASLGVSFDQVAAALSAMTLVGISTDEATTSLVQIFSALLKTTPQAEEALKGLGLSSAGLREELREKGLLATLRTLQERFGDDETAAAAVFGNIRALRGITALLTLDETQLNKVFADTSGALGNLEQAYKDTDGPQRQIDQAMAELQATAIELGQDVLPVVVDVLKDIAGGAKSVAEWWHSLDSESKKLIVQTLAWLAVAGPLLIVTGKLVSGLGAMFKAIGFLTGAKGLTALLRLMGSFGLIGVGVVGAVVIRHLSDAFDDWLLSVTKGQGALDDFNKLIDLTGHREWATALQQWGVSATEFADLVEAAGGDAEAAVRALNDTVRDGTADMGAAFDALSLKADPVSLFKGWGPRGPKAIADALAAGADTVAGGAQEGIVDPVQQAMDDARDAAIQGAKDILSSLESELAKGPDQLKDEMQAILDALVNPYTTAERLIDLRAKLMNTALLRGLRSGDPRLQAETNTRIDNWLDQWKILNPELFKDGRTFLASLNQGMQSNLAADLAFVKTTITEPYADEFALADILDGLGYEGLAAYVRGMALKSQDLIDTAAGLRLRAAKELALTKEFDDAGFNVGDSWVDGVVRAIRDGAGRISYALNYVRPVIEGFSPPKKGPLKDIDTWGANVGRAWIGNLADTIAGYPLDRILAGVFSSFSGMAPSFGLATASVPSLSGAAAAGALIGGSSTTHTSSSTTINLGGITLNGVGSDVSPAAAHGFAQLIHDELANTMQEQSARFTNRPRVLLG